MGSAHAADLTYSINCGGGASGSFAADGYASGGTKYTTAHAIDTSDPGGTNDFPSSTVYQSERYGMNFAYTFPHLTPGTWYFVRLHFAEYRYDEDGYGGKSARLFNVNINGSQQLTNFDVYHTAGADYKAVLEQFVAAADSNGKITIVFTGVTDNAEIKGIEVFGGIHLTNPFTTGHPEKGDGTNQYVYGGQQPDGYLEIPGEITATGATTNESQALVNPNNMLVDLKIENTPIPKTLVHTWKVNGSSILVKVPDRPDGTTFSDGKFVFQGLPDDNTGFGNHQINLYIAGNNTETANIQTFYTGVSSNYPNADGSIPNWFYYYGLDYPTSAVYSEEFAPSGGSAHVIGTWSDGKNVIEESQTYIGSWSKQRDWLPVFAIAGDNKLAAVGELSTRGIYSYLAVNAHELEHLALWYNNDVVIHTPSGPPPPGVIDTDGDGIPDNIEPKYHLDPEESDTTGYYGPQSNSPDEGHQDPEALCDISALGSVTQNQQAYENDWANFGVNFGVMPKYFPYQYTPYSSNESTTNHLPSGAITQLP